MGEAADVVQVLGQITVALVLQVLLCVHLGQAATGHAQDDGSQRFNVVLGQCESLNLGELFVHSDVRNGLPQGLKSVVQFVHPLPLSLVALQPAHVALLGAAVLASATTCAHPRSGTALDARRSPRRPQWERGLRSLLFTGAWLCIQLQLSTLPLSPRVLTSLRALSFRLHA